MTKFAFYTVLGVTACLYAVLHLTFGITGLWWLVAFAFFPMVAFVAAFLTSLAMPSLFETGEKDTDIGEDEISVPKSVIIVDEGPSLGTFRGHPIHEFLDVRCYDDVVRRFEYLRVSENERFDTPPADRWIVVYDMLYVFNNPKPIVAQPESTVQ